MGDPPGVDKVFCSEPEGSKSKVRIPARRVCDSGQKPGACLVEILPRVVVENRSYKATAMATRVLANALE